MRRAFRIGAALAAGTVVAGMALGGVAPAARAGSVSDYVVERQWGASGAGAGQFTYADGVAVDAAGNVYVTDVGNSRVQRFSATGAFLGQWTGGAEQPLDLPNGIAIDRAGDVYVTDRGQGNLVRKFRPDGTPLLSWGGGGAGNGQFNLPTGIAVDAAGSVYVADSLNNRVQKFTSGGTYLTQWGGAGSGEGQFNWPSGLAVSPNGSIVYVSDARNHRVQLFTSSGAFISSFGTLGSRPGTFLYPSGLAMDAEGDLFVSEVGGDRVQKFSPSGTLLGGWGGYGSDAGRLYGPTGVAAGPMGRVYVVDAGNDRIQAFRPADAPVIAPPRATRAPSFTSAPKSRARVGRGYSSRVTASGVPAVSRYTVVAGKLPRGLRLAARGRISGTPKKAGVYRFTVRAENSVRPAALKRFTIRVRAR